nr:ATP-binding cassette domain-containing protein [Actinobaculum suis]
MNSLTQSPGGPPAIQISNLHKHFGDVKAVRGISLTVERGEIVAFLGPNGAGKTTTLDIVLGLTRPTAGKARVLGGSPQAAINDGKLSAVLQSGGFLNDFRVGETIDYIAATFNFPTAGRFGVGACRDCRSCRPESGEMFRW